MASNVSRNVFLFLILWKRGWCRAVGLVERSGADVNGTVFGRLVSPENKSFYSLRGADIQFYICVYK